MHFLSTQGKTPPTSLAEALVRGLAPDGGLYMPAAIPSLSETRDPAFVVGPWPKRASVVMQTLFTNSMAPDVLNQIVLDALSFPVPLVKISDRIWVLELFRGPTLAFKDVGARFMARLLAHFRKDEADAVTVLTATSGDTGGAVAQAFHGLGGVRVVVLFPDGKVTPRQERQFSTLGGNVTAVAVQGDFDACQRMAKEAFRERTESGVGGSLLTSANSINVGRFLPQATYFWEAWARLREAETNRTNILFSVPSGNFGNLAAGLLAKATGLPECSFLAATNENDVVPKYLLTGRFQPRPSVRTHSTAMDVGNPSNLRRILHLYSNDLNAIRRDLVGRRVSDSETMECIRRVHRTYGYVLDPHSAVGFHALEEEMESRQDTVGVLLATAHPAKFAEVVEPVLGEPLPIPPELSGSMEGTRNVVRAEPRLNAIRHLL
jgi:threonine synthase